MLPNCDKGKRLKPSAQKDPAFALGARATAPQVDAQGVELSAPIEKQVGVGFL